MTRTVTRREFLRLAGASGVAAMTAGSLNSFAGPGFQLEDDKYGVIILVDGLRSDIFYEMVEEGELDYIKEHLVDRGASMECVAPLPSTTGPAHLPFLTGTFPGTNHITGIRWMDRRNCFCRDYCAGIDGIMINNDYARKYGVEVKTLFEDRYMDEEYTAAIYEIVNRGADYSKKPSMKELWWIKGGDWERVDSESVSIFGDLCERRGSPPRFTFIWMPGVDHISHFYRDFDKDNIGAVKEDLYNSKSVRKAISNVDRQIGKIVRLLKDYGIYNRTLLGLVSDHGLRDNKQNWDLDEYLRNLDLHVKGDFDIKGYWGSLGRYNAVVAVSGNAFAHVYLTDKVVSVGSPFSGGYDWRKWNLFYDKIRDFTLKRRTLFRKRKGINLIEELLKAEAVGLLIVAEKPGRYLIFSRTGRASIDIRDTNICRSYRYSIVEGDDPLGYSSEPGTAAMVADGNYHSGYEWFRASCPGRHPDAIVQISQLFKSHRCGDIVVLAKPGFDLKNEKHEGSHGSIEREEMMTPAVLAGPGIANKRMDYARTVDIYPTLLKFFFASAKPRREIDGIALDIFDQ